MRSVGIVRPSSVGTRTAFAPARSQRSTRTRATETAALRTRSRCGRRTEIERRRERRLQQADVRREGHGAGRRADDRADAVADRARFVEPARPCAFGAAVGPLLVVGTSASRAASGGAPIECETSHVLTSMPAKRSRARAVVAAIMRVRSAEDRAHFPQLGEEPALQRRLQIRDAQRPAGARLHADHALHHCDVATAPQQHALVEVDQILEQQVERVVLLFVLVDGSERATSASCDDTSKPWRAR